MTDPDLIRENERLKAAIQHAYDALAGPGRAHAGKLKDAVVWLDIERAAARSAKDILRGAGAKK